MIFPILALVLTGQWRIGGIKDNEERQGKEEFRGFYLFMIVINSPEKYLLSEGISWAGKMGIISNRKDR